GASRSRHSEVPRSSPACSERAAARSLRVDLPESWSQSDTFSGRNYPIATTSRRGAAGSPPIATTARRRSAGRLPVCDLALESAREQPGLLGQELDRTSVE